MDSDFPFPYPTTKTQAQHLRNQYEASIAFRALNTQPDPDMERVLVALGCDGDSLHDLLVAAEAMRAEVERPTDDLRAERAMNIHAGPVLGPLKAENERLLALIDSVLACDGADRTTHITVEIPFDLYHALEEARRV